MTDSIETSEREARPVDLRTEAMRKMLPVPAELLAADPLQSAAEPPTAQRLQQLANAVRLALVFLKDDQATAADRDLVVAELERCLGRSHIARIPTPTDMHQAAVGLYRAVVALGDQLDGPTVMSNDPAVNGCDGFSIELPQPQPPKDWGVSQVPFAIDIVIFRPDGHRVLIRPDSDPLLYELASAMLQLQPTKGWRLYRVPGSHEILISKPNGFNVRIQPVSDPLLYQLASDMLAECGL